MAENMFTPFVIAGIILFIAFAVTLTATHHYHTKHGDIAKKKENFVSYRNYISNDENFNPRY